MFRFLLGLLTLRPLAFRPRVHRFRLPLTGFQIRVEIGSRSFWYPRRLFGIRLGFLPCVFLSVSCGARGPWGGAGYWDPKTHHRHWTARLAFRPKVYDRNRGGSRIRFGAVQVTRNGNPSRSIHPGNWI